MALWTDSLAWVVVALFTGAVLAERRHERLGCLVGSGAWVAFAGFWLALVPHFALTQKSLVEGVGSLVAVPACLLVGYHYYHGRDSLSVATRAVAVMGLIYLPISTVPWLSRPLIETTTRQTELIITALGYEPTVTESAAGLRNYMLLSGPDGQHAVRIVLACTGVGSMVLFAGVIAAVDAPWRRKLRPLAVTMPVIWGLNLVRTTFITLAHGNQWFRGVANQWVLRLFGTADPDFVSYLIADRLIAQSLSVVAIMALLWLVIRELPELGVLLADLLSLLTGTDDGIDAFVTNSQDHGRRGGREANGPEAVPPEEADN